MLYNMLKKLIDKKYYSKEQSIIDLLNNFATFEQITVEQYSELMLLVDEKYKVTEEEKETTEIQENNNNEDVEEVQENEYIK